MSNSVSWHSTTGADPGIMGMVTTVSGLPTKPGLAVWTAAPDGEPPLVADLASDARAATAECELVDHHRGPATVATSTVTYDGRRPARTVVIADVDERRRCLAASGDPSLAEAATCHELIGTTRSMGSPSPAPDGRAGADDTA